MKRLAATIERELKVAEQYAVYDPELSRVWPRDGEHRRKLIQAFAKDHGWRVGHYKEGFVAIFTKDHPPSRLI